jgi:hypothetical protein
MTKDSIATQDRSQFNKQAVFVAVLKDLGINAIKDIGKKVLNDFLTPSLTDSMSSEGKAQIQISLGKMEDLRQQMASNKFREGTAFMLPGSKTEVSLILSQDRAARQYADETRKVARILKNEQDNILLKNPGMESTFNTVVKNLEVRAARIERTSQTPEKLNPVNWKSQSKSDGKDDSVKTLDTVIVNASEEDKKKIDSYTEDYKKATNNIAKANALSKMAVVLKNIDKNSSIFVANQASDTLVNASVVSLDEMFNYDLSSDIQKKDIALNISADNTNVSKQPSKQLTPGE